MRNQIIYTVTIILMLISCESEVKKESKTEKFVELIIETEQETKEEITVISKFASIGCIACHHPKSKIYIILIVISSRLWQLFFPCIYIFCVRQVNCLSSCFMHIYL